MAGSVPKKKASPKATKASHNVGHRQRLRKRVLDAGETLADYELLEFVLCAVIPRRDVKPIAKDLLKRFGDVSSLLTASPGRMMETDGIGMNAAAYLRAIHLLGLRAGIDQVRGKPLIASWAALINYVKRALQDEPVEQFRTLFLDRRNRLISDEVMGKGTIDQAPVYPREIARRAVELSASSVILVHNHPGGDPAPSAGDVAMTRQIVDCLSVLEITVHDHLVVGKGGMTSFKTQGLL